MTEKNIMKITRALNGTVDSVSTKKMIQMLNETDYSNKPIYEFIDADTEFVKPYFDIDCPAENKNKDSILNKAKKYICKNFNVTDDALAISDSCNESKISYHISIHTLKITPDDMRKFKNIQKENFKKYFIDLAPYGKTQKFRVITTSKEGQKRPLVPITHTDDNRKHFITVISKDATLFQLAEQNEQIENIDKNKDDNKIIMNDKPKVNVQKSTVTLETLTRCVNNLNTTESRDEFIIIISAIMNVSTENNFIKKGVSLCHQFSMKSKKYNKEKLDITLKGLAYKPKGVKFPTLMGILKIDNPDVFKSMNLKPYNETKLIFEQTHFKCMTPIMYCTETEDDIIIKRRNDLIDTYENKACTKTETTNDKTVTKTCPFVKEWLKDETIRTYDKIDFMPNSTNKNIYNLYTGMRAETLSDNDNNTDKDIDVAVIFEHLSIMVNHDPASIKYFTAWMAQIVQKPEHLEGIALVFKSEQGAGKNIFINWFGEKILGEKYFFTTPDIETLFGRFAFGKKHKLLINLDETSGKDTFTHSERLKNDITSTTTMYEQKGIDGIVLKNFARWIFTTNTTTPIKVEQKDRRFVLFECSNEKCIVGDKTGKNKLYFKRLAAAMEDQRVQYKFFKYLLNYDISNIDFIEDRPITELYKDVQQATVPVIVKYLESLICKGVNLNIGATIFFENYNNYIIKYKYKVDTNITTFARDVLRYKGITKKKTSKGAVYTIEADILKDYLLSKGLIEEIEEVDFLEDDIDDELNGIN